MDISVRRLNHRLALQLPKELPLGLVFVTGIVDSVNELPIEDDASNRTRRIEFDLVEEDYLLHCILTQSSNNPTTVWEGEKVRLGGHLVFDPLHATYFLTTHDVEIIFDEEEIEPLFSEDSLALVHEQKALLDALAGVRRRSQAVSQLEPAELPLWVKKIAPVEVRASLGIEDDDLRELDIDPVNISALSGTGDMAIFPEDMVSDLGAAMEGEEDVVLTTDLLSNYVGDGAEAFGSTKLEPPARALGEIGSGLQIEGGASSVANTYQEDIHDTDWLVILLIVVFGILIIVLIIVTIILVLN